MQNYLSLFTDGFLKGAFGDEFQAYVDEKDAAVLERLHLWAERSSLNETSDEHGFISTFFETLWGYVPNGHAELNSGFHIYPQYPVAKAGQRGGTGKADLGLAYFSRKGVPDTVQVVCEFKDVRSGLDAAQKRKGNDRSPVQQCADYLKEARAKLFGNEPIQPKWAIVTDMNEFRLYFWGRIPSQYQKFVISGKSSGVSPLLGASKSSQFQRFVFWRIFQPDMLLTVAGPSKLEQMLGAQWKSERDIETDFYLHYRAFRESLYTALLTHNPGFNGTRGDLVRYSQRIVDRLIFVLYCEDMGKSLDFPQNLLRDVLREISASAYYQADDTTAWDRIKQLFQAMATGTPFAGRKINYFNGGLFASDPVLEGLRLPTEVFCKKGQDTNPDCAKDTLLFLSATYNFGLTGDGNRTITLLTLGRIFEQSITELEIRAAEEDDLPSINKLSKRKRDGVYYTPEWVTRYLVQEVVGRRLESICDEIGWKETEYPTEDQIERKTTGWHNYRKGLEAYRQRLEKIRIIDPACGSGAFLIQALEFLLAERRRISDLNAQLTRQADAFDSDEAIRGILATNIFGVDINPESVEITKLALWLHTAVPRSPLTTLDANIRCGNSLISPAIYSWSADLLSELDENQKERINAFDWARAFPEAFADGGFDCVVGNPPYVKLQNFRKVEAHAADFLVEGIDECGEPAYRSTQTGNFDLYLPFIEKGLSLLRKDGRMGYIAPSVWLKNEYGEALREYIAETKQLERWIDFASYMVFDEAIVYTALQFFTKAKNQCIRFAFAPDGAVSSADWDGPVFSIPYAQLPSPTEPWNLLPENDRTLISKLYADKQTLKDVAAGIIVGVQTSADSIFHLKKISNGKYRTQAGAEIFIEDSLMRPLVSGPEADRYTYPKTETYLLFPYELSESKGAHLITAEKMSNLFPHGWTYLKSCEKELRAREDKKMDFDDGWWGYNYPKNLDKQHLPKLIVAQTVPEMRVSYDHTGEYCLNNVRVNGILGDSEELWMLLGILNSPATDFVFRRIAKPKEGGYFEANKQFIAPLPIPKVDTPLRSKIVEAAKSLAELHSRCRELEAHIEKRFNACTFSTAKDAILWPTLPSINSLKEIAPADLGARQRTAWAKLKYKHLLEEARTTLLARIMGAQRLRAKAENGELILLNDSEVIIDGVFFDEKSTLWSYWWRHHARIWSGGRSIINQLLKVPSTENPSVTSQISSLSDELDDLVTEISSIEHRVDDLVAEAFKLTAEERTFMKGDPRRTWS